MTEPLPHPAGPDPIRVRQLFREAFSLPPAQRDRIVRQRANGDEALAREVMELLRAAALGATADLQAAGQAGLDQARAAGAPSNDGPSTATDELLGRLAAAPRLDSDRYEIEGDAGGGGMGAILCLHDRHLNRRVAMKVPFDRLVLDAEDQRLARDLLGRFLAEAQVTSQLDHPGVVPVHDIGLDQNGRVYFTMRLVQGRTADQVFADAKAQRDGWTTTRALEVLLKVCDTTAFAHARGVLHRDLKPANVMVGAYGEVYVLDWGLAKVSGTPERTGTALRPTLATTRQQDNHGATHPGARMGTPSYMSPEQARGELVDERTDVYAIGAMLYELLAGSAPFATLGLGPQQIVEKVATASAGDLEALDRSIPAELVAITERAMARERDRRYAAVADLAADLRAFLDQRAVRAYRTGALVELRLWMRRNKALAASLAAAVAILIAGVLGTSAYAAEAKRNEIQAKQEGARADAKVREFDLLSGVVLYERAIANEAELYPPWPHKIAAMETWLREDAGKLLEMRPEIERTIRDLEARALPPTDEERAADRRSHPRFGEYERQERWVASLRYAQSIRDGAPLPRIELTPEQQSREAIGLARFAWERVAPKLEERLVLGDEPIGLAAALLAAGKAKGTPHEAVVCDTLAWALFANGQDAEAMRISSLACELAPKEQANAYHARLQAVRQATAEAARHLADAERDLAALSAIIDTRRTYRFDLESERFLHFNLVKLFESLASLDAREKVRVEQRLSWARQVHDLTLARSNPRHRWDDVRTAIASNPKYAGQRIDLHDDDLIGLVPIGENPATKLWEFYDLRSAWDGLQDPLSIEVPVHREDGTIDVARDTGIVFVLLPGGTFRMGRQKSDSLSPHYDRDSDSRDMPHSVTLAPFFLARHEITRGQWQRLHGRTSFWFADEGSMGGDPPIGASHPAESIDWYTADECLRQHGLCLPTEAQWEYACGAGTDTLWWTGNDVASLQDCENLVDMTAEEAANFEILTILQDGFAYIAPVGRFRANPFGLFDMHGNVSEWCADPFGDYMGPVRPRDGYRLVPFDFGTDGENRLTRGGSYGAQPRLARTAVRIPEPPKTIRDDLGVRAARPLTR